MKFKSIKNTVIILILIICAFVIYRNSNLMFINPFHVEISDLVYATLDTNGNQIILDSSGKRILKLNDDGEVIFTIQGGKKSGSGFYSGKRLITDAANHIYVLNVMREDSGYKIIKEEIVEYSQDGEYLGIIYSITHDEPVLVENIAGLFSIGGELAYIVDEPASFTVFNKDNTKLRMCKLEGTRQLNISYAIDKNINEICYSTKQGKIYKYSETQESELLYDSSTNDKLSVPREISFDPNGNLYFTDIGLRTVSMINEDGTVTHVISDGEAGVDYAEECIYYSVNASNGLIAVTNYYASTYLDGIVSNTNTTNYASQYSFEIIVVWAAVIIMVCIILYIFIKLAILIFTKGEKTLKLSIAVVFGVICIAGIFLLIVLPDFEDRLMESVLQRAQVISDVTSMTLPAEEFKQLDSPSDYMSDNYIAVRESVNDIFLTDSEGISGFYCVLYRILDGVITTTYSLEDPGVVYPYDWPFEGSDEQWIINNREGRVYESLTNSEGSFLFVLNPLFDKKGDVIGLVEVGTNLDAFNVATKQMIYELMLHVLAITIIVVLIALEFIIFMHGRSQYLESYRNNKEGNIIRIPNDLIRILVFGIFFITNITTSFLPLHAMIISEAETGLNIPVEVLAAIPISAEVLFGAIFSIMGNFVFRLFGYKRSALLGSILMTVGFSVRFMVPSIWFLTLGNSIMGCGWGILLLLVNSIIARKDNDEKNSGFAAYSAAAFNGINCGIVLGGFLVNWFSYNSIFMITALLSLSLVAYVVVYLNKGSYIPEQQEQEKDLEPIGLFHFLTSKGVLRFFLLIVIPVVACGYFLNYMFPILGAEYGLSETKVGYSYLFNGLCVICFSSVLTNYFSKKVKKAYSLVFASLLYSAAFLCVAYFQNITSLIVVLIVLGISDSFGMPLQTSYYTDLDAVKKFGLEKSMGIYSLFENIAQAGGSFVFSYVLIIGVRKGLTLVVCIVAIFAVLFGILYFISSQLRKGNLERKREVQVKA